MNNTPPSIAVCLHLMDEYAMLANIRLHSFIVARVADAIHDKLQLQGGSADLPGKGLLTAGALLHDIAKTGCIQEGCDHARVGGDICDDHGYPEIAEIVREHVRLRRFSPESYAQGIFLAKELVYYADKRVVHDKIVSLPARLDYILERYGNNDPSRHLLIRNNFQQCRDLEEWICRNALCTADQLLQDVDSRPYH